MARHPSGKGRDDRGSTVTVRGGDSLWAIAEERVGPDRANDCWRSIYRANRGIVGGDPDHIEPGQRLTIPEGCT